jgi:hypothetical protein
VITRDYKIVLAENYQIYFMRPTEDFGLISQILESRELKHPKIPAIVKEMKNKHLGDFIA